MTTPNENEIYPNLLLQVEKKEEKMTEASPNQTATTERNQETRIQDNKELLSTTTGTATSSPKNRN
jgi:hypothetical protein